MTERRQPLDVPSISPRHRSTPCQSGVSVGERAREPSGSWETGKNVPENRNIGMITKRKIGGERGSPSVVAAKAAIGSGERHADEDARPGSRARRASELTAPKAATTAR